MSILSNFNLTAWSLFLFSKAFLSCAAFNPASYSDLAVSSVFFKDSISLTLLFCEADKFAFISASLLANSSRSFSTSLVCCPFSSSNCALWASSMLALLLSASPRDFFKDSISLDFFDRSSECPNFKSRIVESLSIISFFAAARISSCFNSKLVIFWDTESLSFISSSFSLDNLVLRLSIFLRCKATSSSSFFSTAAMSSFIFWIFCSWSCFKIKASSCIFSSFLLYSIIFSFKSFTVSSLTESILAFSMSFL